MQAKYNACVGLCGESSRSDMLSCPQDNLRAQVENFAHENRAIYLIQIQTNGEINQRRNIDKRCKKPQYAHLPADYISFPATERCSQGKCEEDESFLDERCNLSMCVQPEDLAACSDHPTKKQQ
eukprot:scaffold448888_cov42-Prasinocladus_malaysianus.AAC.1